MIINGENINIYINWFVLIFLLSSCHFDKSEYGFNNKLFEPIKSENSGITFSNDIKEDHKNFFLKFNYLYDGAGVAVGDINNDGLPDIYFTGNQVPNKLFLNLGNFQFQDITKSANVSGEDAGGWSNGVVMVDINNDNLLDIYVSKGGWKDTVEERKNVLFINQGNLTFKEKAKDYGLDESGYSIQSSFFDMDNDGDLDVYITNRPETFFISIPEILANKKNPDPNTRDKLFINEKGVYREAGEEAGITNNFGYGLSIATADINQDNFTDIFVANDFTENDYIYINQGDATFRESIDKTLNHTSFFSMGTDMVDINNDGLEDILITEMKPNNFYRAKLTMPMIQESTYKNMIENGFHHQYMHNMLQLNTGNGFFSEISQLAGIAKTGWSWTVLGSDFNNDSFRDVFITNGLKRDINNRDAEMDARRFVQQNGNQFTSEKYLTRSYAKQLIELYPTNKLANYIFENNGDLTFGDKTAGWGLTQESISHGAAVADFNKDGALDLVVNNMDGDAFLYKNKANEIHDHNYLRIRLEGPPKNTYGLGGKIHIKYGEKEQFYQMKITRGYLSSSEPIAHFGLGIVSSIDTVMVTWPDGKQNVINHSDVNQTLKIQYSSSKKSSSHQSDTNFIFSEMTDKWFHTPYVHQENELENNTQQFLLPHGFSQNGPFLTTGDVNNDGLDDFYIGGASGYSGQLFIQKPNKKFEKKNIAAFENDRDYEDMESILFDANGDEHLDLYVVSGGNEFSKSSKMYQDRLYLNLGNGDFIRTKLPEITTSGSTVVPADYDDDGDMDLFVGGRLVPNAYPFPAKSYLLENKEGVFVDITDKTAPGFSELGLVTSAVWSNIDGKKGLELIVAGEWMPIKVYKFENGEFNDISSSLNLHKTEGWWNKIVASDLNNDGRQELIAGNLGLNYKFDASTEEPFHVFADDFNSDGIIDVILANNYDNKLLPVRNIRSLDKQLPGLSYQFPTFRDFSESSLKDIFGTKLDKALHYKAHTFASEIFTNSEYGFEVQKLPSEAQFSTINGISVFDYNKDGFNDLLIAGNKFDTFFKTTRSDASIGLLLKGNSDETFHPIPYNESGIFVPFDVKSISPINLGNERFGLLIASNQHELKLYVMN